MTDLILQIGASKLAISLGLAGVAWIVQRRFGRPSLTHGFWLLALAVLLVPPLVSIPAWPGAPDPVATTVAMAAPGGEATPAAEGALLGWLEAHGKEGLVGLWLFGTVFLLGWTLVGTLRFRRSLLGASEAAPRTVQRTAAGIARDLGLRAAPSVYVTHAHLSPMVWWAGGETRVLLPSSLLADLDGRELRCILAHELAHVRRRDHVVRWLEWLACAAFWWNPVAWWARRRLRASEELCCDTLAVATIKAEPRVYAEALLRVIAFMSTARTPGPLTFASTVDRCGRAARLEGRFRMIMTNEEPRHTPAWLRGALRLGTICLLAGGLIYCTDQADITSIDPALVPTEGPPPVIEADSPEAEAERRAVAAHMQAVALERALPRQLAEALGDAAQGALAPSGRPSSVVPGESARPADMFLAVTPDDGTEDPKVVELDLAGLRSALLDEGLSPAAVRAELVRHLRVRTLRANRFFSGLQVECRGFEGTTLSSPEGERIASTMTCEQAVTSDAKIRLKR